MCAVFVCFSLSLLSGLSHQDYSSILLFFPNTIAKGCVLSFPLAFSVPTNQELLYHSWCPPCGRDSESPPFLPVVTSVNPVQLTTAGTFGLLLSALFFPLFLSLSVSFPLTNPVSSTMSEIVTSTLSLT